MDPASATRRGFVSKVFHGEGFDDWMREVKRVRSCGNAQTKARVPIAARFIW